MTGDGAMEDFAISMGERIRQRRTAGGLTQDDVAKQMMIKRETYNTIENGKRALKDCEIASLAKILGVSTDFILQGVETKYLDIATVTGLSNDAINTLEKLHPSGMPEMLTDGMRSYEKLQALEALLTCEEGQELLIALYEYLNCDYSKYYLNTVNAQNNGLMALDEKFHIYLGNINDSMIADYIHITPEKLEFAVLEEVIEKIKNLRKKSNECFLKKEGVSAKVESTRMTDQGRSEG